MFNFAIVLCDKPILRSLDRFILTTVRIKHSLLLILSVYCTHTADMFQRAETFLWPLKLQFYSGMIAALPVVLMHDTHQ